MRKDFVFWDDEGAVSLRFERQFVEPQEAQRRRDLVIGKYELLGTERQQCSSPVNT
jgi:hypothetical protein